MHKNRNGTTRQERYSVFNRVFDQNSDENKSTRMLGKWAILSSGKSRKADDPVKRIVSYSPTFMAIRRMGYPFQQLPQWLQMK